METRSMITKKTTRQQDAEILETTFKFFLNAYCNSKKILSGCALGQAHRGFHQSINHEMRMSERFRKTLEKVRAKYSMKEDFDDYVPEVRAICKMLRESTEFNHGA